MLLLLIYILLAVFVGWMGQNKSIGFVGYFLLSLVVTPIVTFAILLMGAERAPSKNAKG
jgi:hypothetical protein|tara:strand:+ start:2565 stop:2741 length:177 start_codon:yes stop_codon:yes gene_type:complete